MSKKLEDCTIEELIAMYKEIMHKEDVKPVLLEKHKRTPEDQAKFNKEIIQHYTEVFSNE